MEAVVLLADAAQVSEGKLNMLGGGWTRTGPLPSNFAVAIMIKVPWDQANRRHHFELSLVDTDGELVLLPTPEGPQAVVLEGDFEAGRPPGSVHGEQLPVPLAMGFNGLPLPQGRRLMFVLSIDGETKEEWTAAFSTQEMPPGFG